jgi:hypothetical protein
MTLTPEDAAQFFALYHQLEAFAINQSGLALQSVRRDSVSKVDMEKRLKVRDSIFTSSEIIDKYVRQNPDRLDAGELAIVQGWTRAIVGTFMIERHLKPHSIFIDNKTDAVYAVVGITEPLRDVVLDDLPIMVRAILLPFKGRIVYDGLLEPYPVAFGGGIRFELKELYLTAKQRREIITSFDATQSRKPPAPVRDWSPEVEALLEEAKKLRAGSDAHILQGPAFTLVRRSLELALTVAGHSADTSNVETLVDRLMTDVEKILRIINRGLPEK